MDFSLSEEQVMFGNYVRKYLADKGETKIARDFIKGDTEHYQSIFSGLVELGCTAITVPEEYGGMGLGALDLVPVLEEMGRNVLPGLFVETNAFAVPILEKFGTEEQKQKYLPGIAEGTQTFSIAWLEPGGSYKPSDIHMTATIEGEDILLNGTKSLVPDARLASSLIVPVRTGEEEGETGISLVILDLSEQTQLRSQKNIDESRHLAELTLKDVRIEKGQLLGPLHQGWEVLEEGLLSVNAALASIMVGGMDKIVEMAAEYAKIRVQFGQPIGRFQAIKHRIADMKVDLETARSLAYYANWALETGADDRVQAIYSARLFAAEAFNRAAGHNVQIHGGIGFTEELDCHLFVKRARFYENYLGSSHDYYEKAAAGLGW
ncbi:acyl-CoA dehydrogenase family protein [Neobacillus mesonae]|uniref:acyl-CoA dehydrogenase family protein n=1 Tax=Neobacillus mesonae TaxID=1193713 RepID=UPI00082E7969|nr:acyl-CoA dehydrogenase family protein [Neobacillus mesonae]